MKKIYNLWFILLLCIGFSSCIIEEDNGEDDKKGIEEFSSQIIGKWKYHAYYDRGWIESPDSGEGGITNPFLSLQFNVDGTFSPIYSSWEINRAGTTQNAKYRSYYVTVKGYPDSDGEYEMQLIFRTNTDTLLMWLEYREYMYLRVKN